jgi:hypothetical protein
MKKFAIIVSLNEENSSFGRSVIDQINQGTGFENDCEPFWCDEEMLQETMHQCHSISPVEKLSKEPPVWDFFILMDMAGSLIVEEDLPASNGDSNLISLFNQWPAITRICRNIRIFSKRYGLCYNLFGVWILPELFGTSEKFRDDIKSSLSQISGFIENQSGWLFHYNFLFSPDNRYQKLDRKKYQSLIRTFLITKLTSNANAEIMRFLEVKNLEMTAEKCFFAIGISKLNNFSLYQQQINQKFSYDVLLDRIKTDSSDFKWNSSEVKLFMDEFFFETNHFVNYLQDDEVLDDHEMPTSGDSLYHFIIKNYDKIDVGRIYESFTRKIETWLMKKMIQYHFSCGFIDYAMEKLTRCIEELFCQINLDNKNRQIEALINTRMNHTLRPDSEKILPKKGLSGFFKRLSGFFKRNKTLANIPLKDSAEKYKKESEAQKTVFRNTPCLLSRKFLEDIHEQLSEIMNNYKKKSVGSLIEKKLFFSSEIPNNQVSFDSDFPRGISLMDELRCRELLVRQEKFIENQIHFFIVGYVESIWFTSKESFFDLITDFFKAFEAFYKEKLSKKLFFRQMSFQDQMLFSDRQKMALIKDGILKESCVFALFDDEDYTSDYLIFPSRNGDKGFQGSQNHDKFVYENMVNNALYATDIFYTPLIQIRGPFSLSGLKYFQML